MDRVAYDHRYGFSQNRSQPWTLLVQLNGAHDQLATEMDSFERVTLGPPPALAELTNSRWRLSQASFRRRSLASTIVSYLAGRLDGDDLARLKQVQLADQQMMRRTVAHVGSWTTRTIFKDWQGYCHASRDIRSHMKSHIQLERESLYPLLEWLARREI